MAEKLSVNPWVGMWVRPRETIRAIVNFNPRYLFPLLSAIYGFPMMLQFGQNLSLGERLPLWAIALGAVVLSTFIGMLGMTIMSALLCWTGKWIGGKASFIEIRAAVSWSHVPNLVNIVIWLIMMGVFGSRLFFQSFAETPFLGHEISVVFIGFLVQVIISVWGFVIALKSLGEVQGFSAWKALLNVLIPFFMVMIVFWILMSVGMSLQAMH